MIYEPGTDGDNNPSYQTRPLHTDRHVLWRDALAVSDAVEMLASLRELPGKTVTVGDRSSSWLERAVHKGHPALTHEGWLQIERRVADALQVGDISTLDTVYWLNEYPPGTWAPLHVDTAGDAQLVVYLAGGSALELAIQGSRQVTEVACGDAVLFAATRVPHATAKRDWTRVSLVARYFLKSGRHDLS